jgi:hypothetical protein
MQIRICIDSDSKIFQYIAQPLSYTLDWVFLDMLFIYPMSLTICQISFLHLYFCASVLIHLLLWVLLCLLFFLWYTHARTHTHTHPEPGQCSILILSHFWSLLHKGSFPSTTSPTLSLSTGFPGASVPIPKWGASSAESKWVSLPWQGLKKFVRLSYTTVHLIQIMYCFAAGLQCCL